MHFSIGNVGPIPHYVYAATANQRPMGLEFHTGGAVSTPEKYLRPRFVGVVQAWKNVFHREWAFILSGCGWIGRGTPLIGRERGGGMHRPKGFWLGDRRGVLGIWRFDSYLS